LKVVLVGCRRWLEAQPMSALQGFSAVPLANPPPTIRIPRSASAEDPARPLRGSAASGRPSFLLADGSTELVEARPSANALTTGPECKQAWQTPAGHALRRAQNRTAGELSDSAAPSPCCSRRSPARNWRLQHPVGPPPTSHCKPVAQAKLGPALVERKLEVLAGPSARALSPTPARGRRLNPPCRRKADPARPAKGEQDPGPDSVLERWRRSHPRVELIGPPATRTCWLGLPPPGGGEAPWSGWLPGRCTRPGLDPGQVLAFDGRVDTPAWRLPFFAHLTGSAAPVFDIAA